MMDRKRRILLCNEASFLSTGYAVYGAEVLKRLHATGKYELAEFASYGAPNDPRQFDMGWKYYGNLPVSEQENKVYESDPANQFGKWKFEHICLDFKPDVIFTILDYWMCSHILHSPFRKFFHYVQMPTVDSTPQNEEWVSGHISSDAIFTYTEWAQEVLRKQGKDKINLVGVATPCADLEVFKPVPCKKTHKKEFGFDPDSLIVGSLMRNQKRKLYPEFINAFKLFLSKTSPEIAKKTFLYFHLSYPDVGWDIPHLIKKSDIGHKIIFTYICKGCHHTFASFWNGARCVCKACGAPLGLLPNTKLGITTEALASVINLFDVYTQYSNCLPPTEEIKLKRGWVSISQVQIGDLALTHTGEYKSILNVFKNPYKNNMKKIKVKGDYEILKISSNHRVYAYTKKTLGKPNYYKSTRNLLGYQIRNGNKIPPPDLIIVKDLQIGDLMCMPIDQSGKNISKIDLMEFTRPQDIVLNDSIKIYMGHTYPRFINISDEFCQFVGLFVADGSVSYENAKNSNGIRVTNNINSHDNKQLCENILEKLTNKKPAVIKCKHANAIIIEVYSTLLKIAFREWCYDGKQKKLPTWIINSLSPNQEKHVLSGLFMGDGCYLDKQQISSYTTVSPILATQIKLLLRRNKIIFHCRIDTCPMNNKNNYTKQPLYTFAVQGNIAKGMFKINKSVGSPSLYFNDYHLQYIKSIKDEQYDDKHVYDIKIKDNHSYTTKIGVIHNSGALEMPLVEAGACGVPIMATDFSGMKHPLEKLNGIPIKPLFLQRECETNCLRAIPDPNDFAEKLDTFLNLSEYSRKRKSVDTRKRAETYFNWNNTSKAWEDHFDTVPIRPVEETWNSTPRIHQPNTEVPANLNIEQFVRWGLINIAGRPDLVNSYISLRMIRDLNMGMSPEQAGGMYFNEMSMLGNRQRYSDFTQKEAVQAMLKMCEFNNEWERRRASQLGVK